MNFLPKLGIALSLAVLGCQAMDRGIYEFTFNDRQIKQPGVYEEAVLAHSSLLPYWLEKKDIMLNIGSHEYEDFFTELFRFLPKTAYPASALQLRNALINIQNPKLEKVMAALGLDHYIHDMLMK